MQKEIKKYEKIDQAQVKCEIKNACIPFIAISDKEKHDCSNSSFGLLESIRM